MYLLKRKKGYVMKVQELLDVTLIFTKIRFKDNGEEYTLYSHAYCQKMDRIREREIESIEIKDKIMVIKLIDK